MEEALDGYVKTWNRGITSSSRPRLLLTITNKECGRPTYTISTTHGLRILLLCVSDTHAAGTVNLAWLSSGDAIDTQSGHKFISEVVQMSWMWRPASIKSSILAPALAQFNALFPRWGVKLDNRKITWIKSGTLSRCAEFIRGQSYRTATAYYQSSPTSDPVQKRIYESPPRFRLDDVVVSIPTPLKVSYDFSSVEDDVAEEGDLTCSVCLTNKPCAAAKCGHLATCGGCATRISSLSNPKCPKCRGPWIELQRIFL